MKETILNLTPDLVKVIAEINALKGHWLAEGAKPIHAEVEAVIAT